MNCQDVTEKREKEVVIDGVFYTANFTVTTSFECDDDYGADADGNRGTHQCFVNEETIDELVAYDENGNEVKDEALLKTIEGVLL